MKGVPLSQSTRSSSPEEVKILVIDDDSDTLRIVHTALRRGRYQVILARSGPEGIEKAKAEKPDLVLTDLAMPGFTGIDVIATLRHDPMTAHLPIVVISAYLDRSFSQTATQAGYDGCLAKPFSSTQLLQEVQKHLSSASRSRATSEPSGATAGNARGTTR